MTTNDNVVEFDWDRLVSWFAALCRRERASDCLPAALWLVCSSDPPVSAGSGASASELEALRELVSELRDRFSCLVAGQPLPRATQSPDPLTCLWREDLVHSGSGLGGGPTEPAGWPPANPR